MKKRAVTVEKRRITVAEFEGQAAATDQLDISDSQTPLLGLVGEFGSLVSALKKKRRDTDAFFGYHEAVVEELGDVFWYISTVALRGGTSLAENLACVTGSSTAAEALHFDDLVASSDIANQRELELSLLRLASEAGDLAKRFVEGAYRDNVLALRGDLVKLLRPLIQAAAAAEVSLEEAALNNMRKTEDRWPTDQRFPTPQDEGLDLLKSVKQFVRGYEAERLPMWRWESAILQGYTVFRELREKRSGAVVADMDKRHIWFEPMTDDERLLCGLDISG